MTDWVCEWLCDWVTLWFCEGVLVSTLLLCSMCVCEWVRVWVWSMKEWISASVCVRVSEWLMCVSVLCTRCLVWLCAALLGISQASKEVSLSLTHSVTHSLVQWVAYTWVLYTILYLEYMVSCVLTEWKIEKNIHHYQYQILLPYSLTHSYYTRLAASVLKCGKRKVWLDPNEVNEISNANSRQNIRKLVKDGFVIKKPTVVHSRSRHLRHLEAKSKGRHTGEWGSVWVRECVCSDLPLYVWKYVCICGYFLPIELLTNTSIIDLTSLPY